MDASGGVGAERRQRRRGGSSGLSAKIFSRVCLRSVKRCQDIFVEKEETEIQNEEKGSGALPFHEILDGDLFLFLD